MSTSTNIAGLRNLPQYFEAWNERGMHVVLLNGTERPTEGGREGNLVGRHRLAAQCTRPT